jgi:hypothetical protein
VIDVGKNTEVACAGRGRRGFDAAIGSSREPFVWQRRRAHT